MLTFEDFFLKKKIDLLKLQAAKPALFAEFSKHYPLMGEKSFDHAKKYWFNQLRRSYPLTETVKPHPVSADAISNLSIQSIAVAAAQNLDAGIEKPKFKEDELVELADQNIPEKDISLAKAEQEILQSELETEKPAFKPRFNLKNIQQTENQPKEEDNEAIKATDNKEIEPAKPAFKPRFNMQNIKKDVVKTASDSVISANEISSETIDIKSEDTSSKIISLPDIKPDDVSESTSPTILVTETKSDTETVKPVYKPRFKMQQPPNPVVEQQLEINENEPQKTESEQTKQVYKPRFQMKNINKPSKPD